MLVSRRSEPPQDSGSHRTVPRPAGKALPQGRCDAGHGVPPPRPAAGAPSPLPHHRPLPGGQRRPQEPSGGRGQAGQGSATPRPADSRSSQPPRREAQTPATRGSSSRQRPPRETYCALTGGLPTAAAGCPSLTWRLPGRSLTASGGGARRSRGCLCRHLHSPLPR